MVHLQTSSIHPQSPGGDSVALARWDDDGGPPCVALTASAIREAPEATEHRRHIDREYEAELAGVQAHVLEMAAKVQDIITNSTRAFAERNEELARRTIAFDDEIDGLEAVTDEQCLRVLAQRQPLGSDLRFITTVMKMITDLERTADLAVHICQRSLELRVDTLGKPANELVEMAQIVQEMLRHALLAFVDRDAERARRVIERDQAVDVQSQRLLDELLSWMREDHQRTDDATRLQAVATYLERIGDHATNLAKMVVIMVQGTDIRHGQLAG
jgi:phosphate transport system protein